MLRKLTGRQKAPTAGDAFCFVAPESSQHDGWGRVINTDTRIGGWPGVILTYIYKARSVDPAPPWNAMLIDKLLLPPFGINALPWSKGFFQTVEHRALEQSDVLRSHCFKDSRGWYFNEHGEQISKRRGIVGEYGLHSFLSIADEIERANSRLDRRSRGWLRWFQ